MSRNPVRTFTENRQGPQGGHHEIPLCNACVKRREVGSWPTRTVTARRMHDGLDRQEETPRGRYVYLEDEQRLRLVRLRTDWLASHAV